ncbi:hypothetical protein LTR62_007233 [Meristemomyces frigidus]|uniref:Uncharacterized protein n=1 Tax=Meristemomyces frigidus TaxID=1508187 RepID=A0AAN7TCC1_9PEZI|nr:hypothetical protein LTR62_007233 [Meristemomyces frigidus]
MATSSLVADWKAARAVSTQSLAKLRSLDATATLLLLTPILLPQGYTDPSSQEFTEAPYTGPQPSRGKKTQPPHREQDQNHAHHRTDPFEALGLALSKQHPRIRHVPYLPTVGFTPTHAAFLRDADAVIVVSCEPEAQHGVQLETVLAKQAEFVGRVAEALQSLERESVIDSSVDVEEGIEGDGEAIQGKEGRRERAPMVNVSFGGDDWENEVVAYAHLWAGECYGSEAVGNVIRLVFGGRQ